MRNFLEGATQLRLLDQIAQARQPLIVQQTCGKRWRLTSPCDFAAQLAQCPLRYVLSDELLRLCVDLAYADGDQIAGCLDLIHIPAAQLWVEWNEAVLREQIARLLNDRVPCGEGSRAGALVSAKDEGRAATIRTFWDTREEPRQLFVAAIEATLDFDRPPATSALEMAFQGDYVPVRDPQSPSIDRVLAHAGFRLDPAWRGYYASTATTPSLRAQVIHGCLSGIAFTVPLLTALFLLLALRVELSAQQISQERINRKRARRQQPRLLDHIELSSPIFHLPSSTNGPTDGPRRPVRFHHVRGHLVRRRNAVFWRRPHWRGHVRLGSVRSRTVELTLR
jgi:hypothetical protein